MKNSKIQYNFKNIGQKSTTDKNIKFSSSKIENMNNNQNKFNLNNVKLENNTFRPITTKNNMLDIESKTSEETNFKTNYTNKQSRTSQKINVKNNSTTPNNKIASRPLSTKSYTSSNKEKKLSTKSATFKDRQNEIKKSLDIDSIDNVKILDNLIYDIKNYGFNFIKQDVIDKMKYKQDIESNIESLQRRKNLFCSQNKHSFSNNSKIINQTSLNQNKNQRMSREIFFVNKELPCIKKELIEIQDEILERKNENTLLQNDILQEENDALQIKDETRRLNKLITSLQKEKESIKGSINLLSKHNIQLNEKVIDETQKSKEFLNNISLLVDKNVKYTMK